MKSQTLWIIGILWLSLIAVSGFILICYQNQAGKLGLQPEHWPQKSKLSLSKDKTNLLMFVHPKCPCTKASFSELERLLAHFSKQLNTILIFSKPAGQTLEWVKDGLWDRVKLLPNTRAIIDNNNFEASLFDAYTSGQVVLYDTSGKKIFSGGLTGSRGHEGGNLGLNTITKYLKQGVIPKENYFAFGCAIR